jgi:NAD(P)-dependent dehydrogenase (short-subunit alcohol dehydrogenase family)
MVTDIDGDGAAGVAAAITQAGGQVASAVLDTTSPDDHQRVVTEVEKRFGALHLAANNAGVTIPATPTAELSLEDWAKVRSVDLDGVFYGVRAQIPALLRAGGGVIVTTSSIAGKRGLQGMAPYAAAKHGVIGLMETIAWEYGTHGIRALSVGPAYIKTGLEANIPDDVREALPGMHALGRMGEPREVGDAVAWLSSDQASFITGSYIPIDGGYLAR